MQSRKPLPVCLVAHEDHWFLRETLRSYAGVGPATVFVSVRAWNGRQGRWDLCASEAVAAGAEVVVGDWPDETLHRQTALVEMRKRGHRHVLLPDGDEIVSPELLENLMRLAEADAAGVVRVSMETYWKSPRYAIRPPERIRPVLMVDAQTAEGQFLLALGAFYPHPLAEVAQEVLPFRLRREEAREPGFTSELVLLGELHAPLSRVLSGENLPARTVPIVRSLTHEKESTPPN